MVQDRESRRDRARLRCQQAEQDLFGELGGVFQKEGPRAASRRMEAYFRNPKDGLEDTAKVYAAIRWCTWILQDTAVPNVDDLRLFAPVRDSMVEGLRTLLNNPETSPRVKQVAFAYAAGIGVTLSYFGDLGILQEGVWSYEPLKPYVAIAEVEAPTVGIGLLPVKSESTLLSDPILSGIGVKLILDPQVDPNLRGAALLAVGGQPTEHIGRPSLIALARGDESEEVRQAAITVIGWRSGQLSSGDAISIIQAQREADTQGIAIGALGLVASNDPGFPNVLGAVLLAQPDESNEWYTIALLKQEALTVGMAVYEKGRDPAILTLLTQQLQTWAGDLKTADLVATVAREAVKRTLPELEPSLRLALSSMTGQAAKAEVEQALRALKH